MMSWLAKIAPGFALKRAVNRKNLEILNSGYSESGASRVKKSMLGWLFSSQDADNDIVRHAEILRQRSRSLYMNAPIANGALKTIKSNVVGWGLRLNSQIDYETLKISRERAQEIERQIQKEFALWANKKESCDAAAACNFYEMQSLALLSVLMSGDCFIALPVIKRKSSIYDLKLNIIEADRVYDPTPKPPQKNIFGGVELDSNGAPAAYYIYNKAKQTATVNTADSKTNWLRVEVFGPKTGRRNVLHLYELERPGQRRGVPILSPVIEMIKQLTRYSEAEIAAAIVSSYFSVFIKTDTPKDLFNGAIPDETKVDKRDPHSYEMGPGNVIGLEPNQSIDVASPARTNNSFDPFVTSCLRQIGTALEIPYEMLVKHFTASYSASRAALEQGWQVFKTRRVWLVNNFCRPVYEEWLSEAVLKGRVNLPGFFDDPIIRNAYLGADFFGSAPPQLDPLKEVNAAAKRVQEGFSTRAQEANQLSGSDFETIVNERVNEEISMNKVRIESNKTNLDNPALQNSGGESSVQTK